MIFKYFPKACRSSFNSCYFVRRRISTYEGEGKTYAKVLNKDYDSFMVDSISEVGFRLNAGFYLLGPCILFQRSFLSWNIKSVQDINAQTLSIFSILEPKIDYLVFGHGGPEQIPIKVLKNVKAFCQVEKIRFECTSTEKATAIYNFMAYEKRYVAGAFIPPSVVEMYSCK